jgi:site-specific recombinase XerD
MQGFWSFSAFCCFFVFAQNTLPRHYQEMSNKIIVPVLKFNRHKRPKKDGTCSIELQLSKDNKQRYFSTGISVLPNQWSEVTKKVVNHRNSIQLNNDIQTLLSRVSITQTEIITRHGSCSAVDLVSALNKKIESLYFYDFALSQLNQENMKEDAIVKTKRFLNRFKDFSNNITIREITTRLLDDYIAALVKENLNPNYINKILAPIHKYGKLCIKYEFILHNKNPFEGARVKAVKTDRNVLTIEEITQIENIKFAPDKANYELVRDLFLFQFYSGMRFSDVCALRKDSITKTAMGYLIDNLKAQKTKKKFSTPLYALFPVVNKPSKPEQLLNKYFDTQRSTFFALPNGKNDKANNQYVNKILQQQIIPKTNIKKHVTTHVARHSFATFLIWKLPVPIVGQLLQHSDIKTTMIYTHVQPENVIQQLKGIKIWN